MMLDLDTPPRGDVKSNFRSTHVRISNLVSFSKHCLKKVFAVFKYCPGVGSRPCSTGPVVDTTGLAASTPDQPTCNVVKPIVSWTDAAVLHGVRKIKTTYLSRGSDMALQGLVGH